MAERPVTYQSINTLAKNLTGRIKTVTNRNWRLTPDNWDCPICRRSKLHIYKEGKQEALVGKLVNHHDHIVTYAKKKTKQIVNEEFEARVLSEKESWFVINKISKFANRFSQLLICEDCNNADANAKAINKGVCKYFSFSPSEIAAFIVPESNVNHRINRVQAIEVFKEVREQHEYRKQLCDVLIRRLLENNRLWGEPHRSPNSTHYYAVEKLLREPDRHDNNVMLELDMSKLGSVTALSKAVSRIEKRRHASGSRTETERWAIKDEKKRRRELTRIMITEGNFFNHGEPWSQTDSDGIKLIFEKNSDIDSLSKKYGRTPGSIKSKLKLLGFIL